MSEENLFPLFHAYNKLVRRGLVKPLTCECGDEFVTTLEENITDDEILVLQCYGCNTMLRPGHETIRNVRAVVTEHFLEQID